MARARSTVWALEVVPSLRPGYPFWSLAVLALDIPIIYGLATYGGQRSRTV